LPATLLLHESVDNPEPPVMVVALRVQTRLVEFVEIARETVPLKPFRSVTEMLEAPRVLTVTATVVGVADSLKSCT
jgi:hypothetical protein